MKPMPLAFRVAVPIVICAGLIAMSCGAVGIRGPDREYWVVAKVQVQGATVVACEPMVWLSFPDGHECLWGIPLTGLVASRLPVARRGPDGTAWTPPLHLKGRWTGSAMAITEKPYLAKYPHQGPLGTTLWTAPGHPPASQMTGGRPAPGGLAQQ